MGKRGYHVMLAEATRELGGRVPREAALPGLSAWIRVRDYRVQQIEKLDNVEVFRESEMTPETILEVGADHVAIATGAEWRRDGFGARNPKGIDGLGPAERLFTPDDIMAGRLPDGPTVIFDDDHYYMGGVLAERLAQEGLSVTLVTPADTISSWGSFTDERWRVRTRLMEMGVELITSHNLEGFDGEAARFACEYSGGERSVAASSLLLVTARSAKDALYRALLEKREAEAPGAPKTLKRIGDCDAPALIAAATFAGHRYARELEAEVDRDNPLKHDRVFFEEA